MVDALSRYQARREQLARGGSLNGDSLEVIGDVLRRGERLGREGVEQALRRLTRENIDTWLQAQKPEALQSTLQRATEESAESALGEEGEDAEVWRSSSLEGLSARDRAESAARAIREWEALHGTLDGDIARRLKVFREGLARLDAALRMKARWFIPLNPQRRAERDILDASERIRAWWFTERADCDDFIAALNHRPERPGPHLQSCSACREDLSFTALVEEPPRRHLSADDLWRFDMGLMSASELKWVDIHTEKCLDCAQAIWALEEGDDAAQKVLMDEDAPPANASSHNPAPVLPRSARMLERAARKQSGVRPPERREVLEEKRDFRVVLVREHQRTRLLIQPLTTRHVMAAVFLSPGKPSIKPQQGPEGLQFDLGMASGRSAHLMVRVGNNEIFERDFSY